MASKSAVIVEAQRLGFADIGFTTAEPFAEQQEVLRSREALYAWAQTVGLDLLEGTEPKRILPGAQSIIVLIEAYLTEAFPALLEAHFGRCYLDDDRITHDGLTQRIKAFREYLRNHGIESKVPFNLPHRLAAARAGLGDFGKNCLFYSNKVARRSSWVLPIAVVVDRAFAADEPTLGVGCPPWCKNACIASCPTGALLGPQTIDPRKCISYLTYFGDGITPVALREPMGMWMYGCDQCQNVCPRNRAWLAQDLDLNKRVAARAEFFELRRLLHMDRDYFETRIWPHMFYTMPENLWRWHMNAARAMGNSREEAYIPDLVRAFRENPDERVKGMAAWALGRIGGAEAKAALRVQLDTSTAALREEITGALALCEG